jgi:hypothetical protein
VASENDPIKPELPAGDGKFPATPTHKIKVPGFSNVWLKDESHNLTRTHKDRMTSPLLRWDNYFFIAIIYLALAIYNPIHIICPLFTNQSCV